MRNRVERGFGVPVAAAMTAVLLCFGAGLAVAGEAGPVVEIDGSGDPGAGHVTVTWSTPGHGDAAPTFQLQESADAAFREAELRYEGLHRSSVVSGLPDGARHFRARARVGGGAWGPWSEPFVFETKHHSLALAGSLFAIGAVAFGLTAAFVVRGASRSREDSSDG